jgi:MinD-like ATPase involved in chromosome partitioning or flagellar assembly
MILERLSNVSYERVFDQLQHEIFKRTGEKAALTAVIVGPRTSPHSANLTAHLGVTLASKDQNDVLIVDANVQDQHLSQRFEAHSAAGFWELCAETKDLMSFVRETAIRRLHLLACGDTSGPPGSPERSVVELVHSFRNHFPFTFMDGGSLETPTTSLLVRHAAATVLLIASGETTESEANAAIQRIESLHGNLIGCVVAGAFKATT